MWAILSDIHGNIEALRAVADDIERHSVQQVICLGDLVGFGPNPAECVDWAMGCDICLQGDFDQTLVAPLSERVLVDNDASNWQRQQMVTNQKMSAARWGFLESLKTTFTDGDFQFVHGSPRKPLIEWVFPEDIHNPRKLEKIFDLVTKYCFKGHTHVPGIFTEDLKFFSPADVNNVYRLDGRKTLIDVGSVGQPRDGDPRACYVLLDDTVVTFRRIDYDVEATVQKIDALPPTIGGCQGRLLHGR